MSGPTCPDIAWIASYPLRSRFSRPASAQRRKSTAQDYAYAQPSLTKKKLRRLEITAGAKRYTSQAAGVWRANDAVRQAERELARQAEVACARTIRDGHAAQANKAGASATPGRASNRPSKGKAARQTTSP